MNSLRIVTLLALVAAPAVAEEAAPRIYVVRPALVDLPDTTLPAILDAIGQAAQDEGVQAVTENDVATIERRIASRPIRNSSALRRAGARLQLAASRTTAAP